MGKAQFTWRDVGGNAQYRLEFHDRVRGEAHTGDACERVAVQAGQGSYVYLAHDVGNPLVIDELLPTVWVRADRIGLQFLAQVVLDWGYFSKPPFVAGMIWLSTKLFGSGVLGVKALGMLTFPATALAMVGFARALWPTSGGVRTGIVAGGVYLSLPMVGLLGLVACPKDIKQDAHTGKDGKVYAINLARVGFSGTTTCRPLPPVAFR